METSTSMENYDKDYDEIGRLAVYLFDRLSSNQQYSNMYGGYTLPKSTNQRVYTVQSSLKHGHYGVIDAGEGIDPYGVLAMIAFSVFLFYIIYSYLNQTGNGGKRGFSDEPHQQIQAIHHSLINALNKYSLKDSERRF
uniref:Uncharacterized protein n=1 Tax=Lepeophtheirus salmonis TaxID=72036 RepID=A0A0K2TIY8_LEPSM|nr:uncharacterized protein LOC121123117 [Lepeophtheirus salmonis]XP_040574164.1 uncharacterized protein LOC121123117 [Lepeophtheirus salmonis]